MVLEMKTYMCIDLKSFYASVECVERNLDPLNTNLVVADASRTEKTICLAVSPSLKKYGLSGRSRLFEVVEKVKKINIERKKIIGNRYFDGASYLDSELNNNSNLKLDYIVAPPRMNLYMKYSSDIYNIYLKYLDSNDIFVYSIDEVFCDLTNYLKYYNLDAYQLVTKIILDVYKTTGITATAGIGTNLYLAKIAMDIVAKHNNADSNGVRIAYLNEFEYRKKLWSHRPITDFWRVGKGYEKKLSEYKIYTMGDIARCSLNNEDFLYKLFGVNAELLIDHAWGYEPVTLEDIKNYQPINNSISSGQVLLEPYNCEQSLLIVKEMLELLSLELVSKKLVTNQLVLTIGYDVSNINNDYKGEIVMDHYGRYIPKHSTGRINIDHYTSSYKILLEKIIILFTQIIDKRLLVRRINITAGNVINEQKSKLKKRYEQFDIFTNAEDKVDQFECQRKEEFKERDLQRTLIVLKNKYGNNSILKAMNLMKGGTTIERNNQVGGHKA